MDDLELDNRFQFHPALDDDTKARHQSVRNVILGTATLIDEVCPEGREKSLSITKLEEAMMWANAAIARQGPVE